MARYGNLDGFRAYAAIGIVIMHIRANGNYFIQGYLFNKIIPSFTNAYLFMLLSAFSLCCGYYDKFKNNTIEIDLFYKRRYARILPFFALLCTLELIVDHSISSLYEWVADLSLAFGLLPNARISVVGVGWFIGIIFAFYMIFPFFIFLIGTKKRAWFVFFVSIILNVLCFLYFFDDKHVIDGFSNRTNIIFCSMFFVAGGLIYLYEEQIQRIKNSWTWILTLCSVLIYYLVNSSEYVILVIFSLLVIIGIQGQSLSIYKILFQNRAIIFLAGISLEIYLCHMFVFRFAEKLNLLHLTANEVTNYGFTCLITVFGAIVASTVWKKSFELIKLNFQKQANR